MTQPTVVRRIATIPKLSELDGVPRPPVTSPTAKTYSIQFITAASGTISTGVGYNFFRVTVIGGGAGGGYRAASSVDSGQGGGGGGCASTGWLPLYGAALTFTYTVAPAANPGTPGSPSNGGVSTAKFGVDGGNSTVSWQGRTLTANGGKAAIPASPTSLGGTATGGDFNFSGGDGGTPLSAGATGGGGAGGTTSAGGKGGDGSGGVSGLNGSNSTGDGGGGGAGNGYFGGGIDLSAGGGGGYGNAGGGATGTITAVSGGLPTTYKLGGAGASVLLSDGAATASGGNGGLYGGGGGGCTRSGTGGTAGGSGGGGVFILELC